MSRRKSALFLAVVLGIAGLGVVPGRAEALYRCPVTIEVKGKAVLKAEIIDVERPSTEELWNILRTLSFQGGVDADAPKTTLKGEIRVKIAGAGEVQLEQLGLVRNKRNAKAWVIAPDDFERILKKRKAEVKGKK